MTLDKIKEYARYVLKDEAVGNDLVFYRVGPHWQYCIPVSEFERLQPLYDGKLHGPYTPQQVLVL